MSLCDRERAYESLLNLCFIPTSHTVLINMECAMLVNIIFLLHVIISKLSFALFLLHKRHIHTSTAMTWY